MNRLHIQGSNKKEKEVDAGDWIRFCLAEKNLSARQSPTVTATTAIFIKLDALAPEKPKALAIKNNPALIKSETSRPVTNSASCVPNICAALAFS